MAGCRSKVARYSRIHLLNIHYYMQFLPGEDSVGSRQPVTFAKLLARKGHRVSVLSTDYNLDDSQKEPSVHESVEGGGTLDILRIPSPRGGRGSNVARLWSYIVFMVRVAVVGLRLEKPDVIVGSIQPLFTGAAALSVAKVRRVPFVLEVRDLWPDALVVKGAMGRRTAAPLFWISHGLYRHADRIVSLTPGIKHELVGKGISPGKIDVCPNGFDPELYSKGHRDRQAVRETYGWGDDLVVIYTGSYTKVTAVEVLVRAANRVKDRAGIRFEFFGDGPTRATVEALSRELGAANITFHDPVPKVEVPGLLAGADVAMMSLFVSPLVHIYFENKFIDYMGAGKPILAAMGGEQAEIITKFGTGKVVPSFDDGGMAQMVRDAAEDFAPFAEMGRRGTQLVQDRLLLPTILDRYADIVERVATGGAGEIQAWEPLQ